MNDSKFLSLNGLIYYDEKLKRRIKELYGTDMTVEWEEIKDGKNPFKLKIALKNGNGTELFAKTVDFPLEQTIVSGSYENSTKSLILYFQDGTSTKIPIKDLIEGLASKLDLDKKANLGVKTTDSNTAHIRDIPENALPYAAISKIGGMTYKDGDTLKNAKVTEVKSVGANLFDKSKVKYAVITDTGFGFTNTGSTGMPFILNTLKEMCPELKVGDVVTFYTDCINGYASNGLIYLVGTKTDWFGGNFITITQADLDNAIYVYGAPNQICEYKNFIMTKHVNAPYTPYTEHTLAIPESVQSLEGYGLGVDTVNNYLDFTSMTFTRYFAKATIDATAEIYLSNGKFVIDNVLPKKSKENGSIYGICNHYELVPTWWNEIDNNQITTYITGGTGVSVRDDSCTTVEDFKAKISLNPIVLVYQIYTVETEDINITSDNLISVEGGGTVTLVNEYGYDVPCDIDFFTGDNKIVGSRVFVGDLMGRASFAKYFDVDGSPSEKTIAEALEDVTREDSPIKVTSTSIGQKATEGLELTVSTDVLANPPAEIGDIVIDAYTDAENLSYINLWEITGFDAGYSTMRIVGINSVNTGGGSASFAQKAEADGNGNNIAGTYATKQALKALEDSANGSIHNIEAAIDGVEANGQALAERLDSLSIVNGVVAKAVTATNAESAKAGSELDISIRDASVNASDALTKATNALASAAENHTIIQNFPNTYAKISDLSDYSLLTESGNSVSVSWEPPVNGVNPYKLNIKLINAKGNEISSAQIDFPLEQMVVGAEYAESTKELVLETLEGTVKVPVSDIFRGLITESNIGNQTVAKASLATKAANDGQGNDIVQTYATNSNLNALENRVDNLDSDCQALADKFDSLGAVNGVVAKAVTATNAESAKAGSGLDNDITQARKDASDALAKANSVLSLVNENKFQLEAIFNEDAPATVQKAKYAETAGSADYASRCRDSNGNPLLISNIVTKADAAELLASQANSASKSAIVSARCEYIKSSYQASVGTLNLYLKTADNREIAVTDFQEALMSLLEDFMS